MVEMIETLHTGDHSKVVEVIYRKGTGVFDAWCTNPASNDGNDIMHTALDACESID